MRRSSGSSALTVAVGSAAAAKAVGQVGAVTPTRTATMSAAAFGEPVRLAAGLPGGRPVTEQECPSTCAATDPSPLDLLGSHGASAPIEYRLHTIGDR
jgi:hypothetical protein